MTDPRKLAESTLEWPDTSGVQRAKSLARELLSALDALEAANKERDAGAYIKGTVAQYRTSWLATVAALKAAEDALREVHAIAKHGDKGRVGGFLNRLNAVCGIALSALAGGGHEPEQQKEQDLGGTAVAVPSSKSEQA